MRNGFVRVALIFLLLIVIGITAGNTWQGYGLYVMVACYLAAFATAVIGVIVVEIWRGRHGNHVHSPGG